MLMFGIAAMYVHRRYGADEVNPRATSVAVAHTCASVEAPAVHRARRQQEGSYGVPELQELGDENQEAPVLSVVSDRAGLGRVSR